ncbi:sugar ABC transporter ATP-binding protein [uncultured Anaerococcus sp.]|uniref:sugar ABC transporter ATP-binding protein n=1 Tax=uncultured Anaerococcus sp. TaxID=293428 RepID=UPI00288A2790|nr:sugar ABC transporter ATP-binding protein [uncultured Anaerococcus sp.]
MDNTIIAKNITKIFPGVIALDDVSIQFEKGKVHAIIGENGAGKSTLIKCLTGVHSPTKGEILLCGKEAKLNDIEFKKVAYVPQEINLFENMSVSENLFMPYEGNTINFKRINSDAKPILKKFKIDVVPNELVKNISVSQKQLLQIARACTNSDFHTILFDEPTTSLSEKDTENFFEIIKELKSQSKAIVFISHKLEEIFRISDVVSIFRNGKNIGVHDVSGINEDFIIKEMTGKNINYNEDFSSKNVQEDVILEVHNITGKMFRDISFNLKRGEILGFSGLVGAGRTELMQSIFGYLKFVDGYYVLDGEKISESNTTDSVNRGLIYLPEERKQQGIFSHLSVRENISVALSDLIVKYGFVVNKLEKQLVDNIISEYNIKTASKESIISYLSGGNQQKVIIGRSMYTNPKVLIFDEPTKGIDIGTKTEIYKLMKGLAEKGISIIIISSEMDELIKCSNRIITLHDGEIVSQFDKPFEREKLMKAILGYEVRNYEQNK